MIGDRDADRQAARAHRLPFVLFTGGFAETPRADREWVARDYVELRALLLAD
jgi:phosphoglycolate phosphatase-like HAD superfamily hydrolase